MKFENFKTILLTVLVLLSFLFTWNLWTYQPKYESIENDKSIQKELPERQKFDNTLVFKPVKVLFHQDGKHYGTHSNDDIQDIFNQMKNWQIYEFKALSLSSEKQLHDITHGNNKVEIMFPGRIPFDLLKNAFVINEKEQIPVSFDRLVVNMKDKRQDGKAYFISYDKSTVYEAHISSGAVERLYRKYYTRAENYTEYSPFTLREGKTVFLEKNKVQMQTLSYLPKTLDIELYKNTLFNNPRIVEKNILANREEYTDGSRMLIFDKTLQKLYYNNNAGEENFSGKNTNIITKSLNFIRDHNGKTNDYRLSEWDENSQKTVLLLYENNLPVLNSSGLTEIFQQWRGNEIIQYKRPLFKLSEIPINIDNKVETLPSPEEAIKKLEALPDFNENLLLDISPGYELQRAAADSSLYNMVYKLVPIWCYLYNGDWKKVPFDQENREGM